MPTSIVAAVAASAVSDFVAAEVGSAIFGYIAGGLAAGFVTQTLAGKPKVATPSLITPDVNVTVRSPAAPWQVIYGTQRVGGVITFIESINDAQTLNLVITLAGHPCEQIVDVYFDDELLSINPDGTVNGKYAGKASVLKSLGDEGAAQPFPLLQSTSAGLWTANHRQAGRTKIALSLGWDNNIWPNGLPNVSAVVKGKKVLDHRFSPTVPVWTDNAALCIADYLTDASIGFGADLSELDLDQLVAAANICDEAVALAAGGTEKRYTLNGAFTVDATPQDILGRLLTAMGGQARYVGGLWRLHPAAYAVPAVTLTADDLRGAVHIMPRLSKRDLCNGVKGVFTSPDNNYQPSDFPAVTNATYLAEDQGETIWRDVELPFTNSAATAQRLAKIELERTRQQLTLELPCKLTGYQVQPGDTVMVTLDRYGYAAKVFEVMGSTLVHEDDGAGGIRLGVDHVLRETASAVFDWNSGEETQVDPAPDTNLPDPFTALAIADLTASSGTADLLLNGDGTVLPRVRLRYTQPSNAFIDHYEVQFARASVSPTEWIDAPDVAAPAGQAYAFPVKDGELVDLRIRAVTTLGNAGDYAYVRGHTVVGKTEVPSDVAGATAVQTGGLVVMGCATVPDADLDSVEIRLQDQGNTSFDNGAPIANILRGQTVTSAALPPGTWELLFKAKDTSGNYSANAARVTITVTADGFTVISTNAQGPKWLGGLTNMVKHWTGVLVPQSQSLAKDLDWEVFDEFVPNAYTDCYYEAVTIDKGIDATARIYGDIVSTLGPGETTGVAAPALQVDTRTSSGAFDGYQDWTVGSVNFRYLLARIHVDTTIGKPVISQFTPTIDKESFRQTGTLTVGVGGTGSVVFTTPFHNTPALQVTPQGSGDVTASYANLTAAGFDGYFKSGGAAAAGSLTWAADGA